tara:strand:- start:212889 stop:214577 length:1689 start_codon:yes stop_codon:yes gene_type:complete
MKKTLLTFTLLFISALFVGAVSAQAQTSPSVPKNLTGYAWSSTIGWVSLTCENAGVCGNSSYWVGVKNNGNIEGYAWSSNVGWISFNSADTAGCPSGTCQASFDSNTGHVSGWAKALAGGVSNSGDWDGWIYLGRTPRVQVEAVSCAWQGEAWGGGSNERTATIGWLSFRGPGYGVTGTNEACVGGGGDPDLTAGTVVATEQDGGGEMLFEVPIQNIGGSDIAGGIDMRLQIAINSDASSAFDQNIDVNNAITNLTAGNFKTGSYTWNNPPSGRHQVRVCADPGNEIAEENEGNNCGPITTFQVDNPGTGGGLSVSCTPSPLQPAVNQSVTWTATVQNNIGTTNYSWSGTDSLSGSSASVAKTYGSIGVKNARIDVDAENASTFATCNVEVTLNGGGSNSTASLSASPTQILVGESTTLTWSSTSASSCTGTGFNTGGSTSGSVQVAPTSDATYQVSCGGAGDFADVEVLQPNITITVNGEADSIRVPKGEVVNVVWHAEDTDSCDIVGPGILVNNATDDPLDGSANVTITERSVYSIECDASTQTFTESITVNIPPDFEEF